MNLKEVEKMIEVMKEMVEKGKKVVVIENNMEVIKNEEWVIEIGKEGGEGGGEIVEVGSKEEIVKEKRYYKGKLIKEMMERRKKRR